MEFKFLEYRQSRKYTLITDIESIKKLKENYRVKDKILIHDSLLNLHEKLYGSNKKETKKIQKRNCKIVVKTYKLLLRLVRMLKKKGFDGIFYAKGLKEKCNNNDMMLCSMLSLHFKRNIFAKMGQSIIYACDYLDAENNLNKMCDFRDNKCAKHRANNFDRPTLCCPAKCKFNCPCKTKNLACKLYMCEYLVSRGYCFSPLYIPILKVHMNFFERLGTWGVFFKSTKKSISFMWIVRVLVAFWSIGLAILALSQIVNLF